MDETNENESHWISKASEGDEQAFSLLFSRYYPMIHAYCYRLSLNATNAEDLAQITFIKAARSITQLKNSPHFKSWLYTIASRCFYDWTREQKRERELHDELALNSLEGQGCSEHSDLHAALQRLKPLERQAITLVYFENLNHREAALIMECAETTVSWRLLLARRTLGKLLKNHDT
jgi:RNA polymerase sigma-70 factor (ECF subfamily)